MRNRRWYPVSRYRVEAFGSELTAVGWWSEPVPKVLGHFVSIWLVMRQWGRLTSGRPGCPTSPFALRWMTRDQKLSDCKQGEELTTRPNSGTREKRSDFVRSPETNESQFEMKAKEKKRSQKWGQPFDELYTAWTCMNHWIMTSKRNSCAL